MRLMVVIVLNRRMGTNRDSNEVARGLGGPRFLTALCPRKPCGAMWQEALPNYLTGSNDPSYEATCQSGYGAVCKTAYPGSIPGVASIEDKPAIAAFCMRSASSRLSISYFKP